MQMGFCLDDSDPKLKGFLVEIKQILRQCLRMTPRVQIVVIDASDLNLIIVRTDVLIGIMRRNTKGGIL
jgi:hypothetical protein